MMLKFPEQYKEKVLAYVSKYAQQDQSRKISDASTKADLEETQKDQISD
jgi:hypothetical protein